MEGILQSHLFCFVFLEWMLPADLSVFCGHELRSPPRVSSVETSVSTQSFLGLSSF